MDDRTYYKILSGKASEEEKKSFFETLDLYPEKKKEYIQLKRLWDLDQIHRIKVHFSIKNRLFHDFWKSIHQKKRRQKKIYFALTYAAVLVLALVCGFYMNMWLFRLSYETRKQFSSENGSISRILLEDGSKIWLNSNTVLTLYERKGEVTAKLQGEAFFDITHDPERTFTVDLGKIRIRDLGTRFNISAYPDESYFRATLLDGKIAVLFGNGHQIKEMAESQTFRFDKATNSYTIEQIDPLLVTGWTKNKFVFIDLPLGEICREIEKWYGISIIVENKNILHEKYTSVIRRTTTVNQLMDMFKLTTGINYRIVEQEGEKPVIYLNK